MIGVGPAHPESGGGPLRSERGVGDDQLRQVLRPTDLRDLAGGCSVPSGFALRSTSSPRSTNRRTTKAVTFAFSPVTFGAPRASAIRSAAAPPEIGGEGIAARIVSASSASTAARDHCQEDVRV
ncbi:hypothetical protein AB0L75_40445 [Streptomyces sp. NPDC052101]|uniref:hypothetical protein n=1 Tax=Streptomyces sp. NPDC052101 TaxID=3155763 RepID=UPI00341853E7